MKKLNQLLILGCAVLTFTGCATSAGQSADAGKTTTTTSSSTSFFDNQSLENSSEDVLKNYYPSGSFSTVAYDNNVLLLGQIPTQANKDAAAVKIKALPKVTNVWNYLEVGKNIGIEQSTKDSYLTTAAKSRLIAQKEVNTNNIKVVTENSTVYLLGKNVGNRTQLDGAIVGIKGIAGVKNVVDLTEK